MNNNYKRYLSYLMISLILTMVGSFVGQFLPQSFFVLYSIMSIVIMLFFLFSKGRAKRIWFHIFSFGEGLLITPILAKCTPASLFYCLLLTVVIVFICSFIGLKTKNLGFLGTFLFSILICIVIYTLMSIFIPLPSINLLITLVFSLYVMYDVNCFKNEVNPNQLLADDEILEHVMSLYLDILNIFISLMKIFGDND